MKHSTKTSFWNLLLATVTAVGAVRVSATATDEQRYDFLDTMLRRLSPTDSAGSSSPYDDDNLDGCISFLEYVEDDCTGPVKALHRGPAWTLPVCSTWP